MDSLFFLFMTLVFPLIASLIGFALGILTKFMSGWRPLLLLLVISSCIPWLLHLLYTKDVGERWLETPVIDSTSFMVTSISLASALLFVSLFASWRKPLFAPLSPLLLGFLYFNLPLAQFSRKLTDYGIWLDNIPQVWLFWYSLAASALLFGYALTKHLEPHTLKHYLKLK